MTGRRNGRADREPTWTFRVVRALEDYGDFLTREDFVAVTGGSHNQIGAALHHLVNRAGVVGEVRQEDGTYYHLTGEDRRAFRTDERVPEPPGNRTRRARVQQAAPPGQ